MLFMQPLFAGTPAPGAQRRVGYADDGRLTARSPCLRSNAIALTLELEAVFDWCTENAVALDLQKSGLLHFCRKRTDENPAVRLPQPSGGDLQPTPITGSLRWLGVLFDRKLSFKPHVERRAGKALKAAQALRLLSGCARGAPPPLMRTAVTACVIPAALFAAEAWWPPPNSPTRRAKGLATKVDLIIRAALRAVLPVYRTTPIHMLHHAAGIPPAELLLDHASRRAAIRLTRLDPAHPLRRAARARQATRVKRLADLPPFEPERVNPLTPAAPALPPPGDYNPPAGAPKQEQATVFNAWQARRHPRDL